MSEKWSEEAKMSDVAIASQLIKRVVPRDHRSVKEWISVTARRLGWTFMRTKGVWYGEARRIEAFEMADLRAGENRKLYEARNEFRELKDRITRLEAALSASDADFHRPLLDALLERNQPVDR